MFYWLKKIKWFVQRGYRGWAQEDVWDINRYLAQIVPPMLRQLKKGNGCPVKFWDSKNKNNECAKWHECLEEMAQGFEAVDILDKLYWMWEKDKDGHYTKKVDAKSVDLYVKKMRKGLQLFVDNFEGLWD